MSKTTTLYPNQHLCTFLLSIKLANTKSLERLPSMHICYYRIKENLELLLGYFNPSSFRLLKKAKSPTGSEHSSSHFKQSFTHVSRSPDLGF